MTPETVPVISAVVAILTELIKRYTPIEGGRVMFVSAGISLLSIVLYGLTYEPMLVRTLVWPYFVAWITITGFATGIYEGTKNVVNAAKDNTARTEADSPYIG